MCLTLSLSLSRLFIFFILLQIGLIFLFNLIVGTGALALPHAFAKAGWLLGLVVIAILAFISYMTVTFVIETMACANAIYYWGRLEQLKRERESEGVSYSKTIFFRSVCILTSFFVYHKRSIAIVCRTRSRLEY